MTIFTRYYCLTIKLTSTHPEVGVSLKTKTKVVKIFSKGVLIFTQEILYLNFAMFVSLTSKSFDRILLTKNVH